MTLNAHNQKFSIHRDLLFAKYGKHIRSGCLSNSIQNLIKDCLGQLHKVRLSLSDITCQNTHCRGCQIGDWVQRLKLLPWAFLCSTEVLKFSILLFIIDVLLVPSSSGQVGWCPGLGPPPVSRRKHPLKYPEKRMPKMPTSPEQRKKPRTGSGQESNGEQGMGVFSGDPPRQQTQTPGELYEWLTPISTTASFPIQKMKEVNSFNQPPLTHGAPFNHQCRGSSDATPTSATWPLLGAQPGAGASASLKPAKSVFPSLGQYCLKTPSVVWKVLANRWEFGFLYELLDT